MTPNYLFTSERLGFRPWQESDLLPLARMNADPRVMEFFPSVLNEAECIAFITRMQQAFEKRQFCYFAVETLADPQVIGFIGICYHDYESPFNPAVDIGWRLIHEAWGKGYATEGAKRCLQYAFEEISLDKVVAIAPAINQRSINVMQKIGMQEKGDFLHPKLKEAPRLERCVWYEISQNEE